MEINKLRSSWITLYVDEDSTYLTSHLPCLKTPIRSDLSASKSHHSAGTSEWSGSGTQTSMSLKKKSWYDFISYYKQV